MAGTQLGDAGLGVTHDLADFLHGEPFIIIQVDQQILLVGQDLQGRNDDLPQLGQVGCLEGIPQILILEDFRGLLTPARVARQPARGRAGAPGKRNGFRPGGDGILPAPTPGRPPLPHSPPAAPDSFAIGRKPSPGGGISSAPNGG